jgi:hypothetical protein
MYSHVEPELTYNIANAPFRLFPYPHIYVPDVFPKDFYAALQENLPDPAAMIPIGEAHRIQGYNERFVLELAGEHLETLSDAQKRFWREFAGWLLGDRFRELILAKFQAIIKPRFAGVADVQFYSESLLVKDITKYSLGPHSDSPKKVVTLLFYLPKDLSQSHLGTSIYFPKDPNFTCSGGPHYGFENFIRLATMPFQPNSLFAFVKTNNSFHGVEPVLDPDTRRWLLLYDVYVRKNIQQQAQAAAPPPTPQSPSGVSFTF